jgi:hypothetical protein
MACLLSEFQFGFGPVGTVPFGVRRLSWVAWPGAPLQAAGLESGNFWRNARHMLPPAA